jgi:hypothetical protein
MNYKSNGPTTKHRYQQHKYQLMSKLSTLRTISEIQQPTFYKTAKFDQLPTHTDHSQFIIMPQNPLFAPKGPLETPAPTSNPPYMDGKDYVCPAYGDYFSPGKLGSSYAAGAALNTCWKKDGGKENLIIPVCTTSRPVLTVR